MENVKAIGKEYEIYSVTGRVLDAKKHYETRVSGGGGGGYSNQGTGYTAPVKISSTTVIHDTIFLEDQDGKEHALELTNYNIVSREGNEMTAVWAIKKNKKNGPYVAIFNHTLSKVEFNGNKLFWMMMPHWLLLAGSLLILVIISFFALLIGIAGWSILAYIKARDLKAELVRQFDVPAVART